MSNVTNLGTDLKFPKEGELASRLSKLIDEYAGEISMVGMLGILRLEADERSFNLLIEGYTDD